MSEAAESAAGAPETPPPVAAPETPATPPAATSAPETPPPAPAPEDDGKVAVTLVKPCRFTPRAGPVKVLGAGTHRLPKEEAEHWFILAHTANPPPPRLQPGTPAYLAHVRALQARQEQAALIEAQQVRQAADATRDTLRAKRGIRKMP
jgi:hypothetical protein